MSPFLQCPLYQSVGRRLVAHGNLQLISPPHLHRMVTYLDRYLGQS